MEISLAHARERGGSKEGGAILPDVPNKLRSKETAEKAHVAQSEEDEPALFMVTASILPDVKETAEKAHVAQSEEDEPALFMVTASILPDVPNSNSKSTEVIDDGITTPVSVEPEEELQLCITKNRLGSQFN